MRISKNDIVKLKKVAGVAVGFVVCTWLFMQAISTVIYVILVIANGIRVALGCGSVL